MDKRAIKRRTKAENVSGSIQKFRSARPDRGQLEPAHMNHGISLCWVVACLLVGCSDGDSMLEKSRNDDVAMVPADDPHMKAAFEKARSTLDEFLVMAAKPGAGQEDFSLKIAVTEGENTEYFWILPFSADGASFSGQVNNTPQVVSTVREGETIHFQRSEIVDWTYRDVATGKSRGNFTACALLKHESEEDAAAFQAEYGLDCDT